YINKYGYVDRYSEKMNRLTAKEYMAKYSKNYKSEKDCILAYQRNLSSTYKCNFLGADNKQ
ncbi:hypothetical protein ACQ1Q5_10495, partial [Ornithobacterium rhinotracheale]